MVQRVNNIFKKMEKFQYAKIKNIITIEIQNKKMDYSGFL